MKKILLLIVIAFLGSRTVSHAQVEPVNPANAPSAGGPITGIIRDSVTNRALEKAVVSYVEAGKTDTAHTLTDAQGRFSFERTPVGDFILIISYIGHQTKGVQYPATMAGNVGIIPMSEKIKELAEVVIQAPPIKVMQDTVEYRADAYPVRKDAVAEDLLKKLPGVEVDAQGNVTAHGQTVTKIRVNGKDFFGGDPKMATKNIPADAIDKIQVIDDQSDQAKFSGFDDGDRTKIINITIKKDRNQGYFGSATAGAGIESGNEINTPYEGYLRAFRFNNAEQMALLGNANNVNIPTFSQAGASFQGGGGRGGGGGGGGSTSPSANLTQSNSGAQGYNDAKTAGFNYANDLTPHLTVFGSYQYTKTQSTVLTNSFTHLLGDSIAQPYFNSASNSLTDQQKHSVMLNVGWGFSRHDSLLFRGSFNYSTNIQNSNTQTTYEDSTQKNQTSSIGQIYKGNNSTPATSVTLLWMHKFNKIGRTLSVTATDNPSPSTETDSNYSVQDNYLTNLSDTIRQVSFFKTNNYSYSGRVSYTEPLSLKSGLELSYAYSSSENVSSKNVYSLDPKMVETFVDSLSNNMDNTLVTNKVGLTFRHKERKFNYQIGASLQPTLLDTKTTIDDTLHHFEQHELVFVPIGSLAYQFSTTKRLRIFYTGTSQQPTPTQLQPVPDITNQQNINLGNPNLKPEFDNHVVINYNNFDNLSGRAFFLNINTNIVNKNIATNTIYTPGAKNTVYYYMPVNANGYYTAGANAYFSQPFNNREFILTLSSKVNFTHDPEYLNGALDLGQTWQPTETIRFEMDKGDWLEVIGGASYALNSTSYSLKTQGSAGGTNTQTQTWSLAQSARVDFLKIFSFRYDYIYTIPQGFSSAIGNKPVTLINAVLESRFMNQRLIAAVSVNDLLNENVNYNQTFSKTQVTQSQSNVLQRFVMFTLTYKLAKFKGSQATGGMMMPRGMRGGDGGGGFGGGGGGRRGG
ncbi:outer membrane beta-barrel protein [Dinghuibacter silviterrae]|uniref:Carboxypeptidase-like protein n=1 Tax=Dinghuibacter silviterrae TaxID=1539049 RepID=A0A4R8DN83_9BACT|nr:outer membrane beta-barrel protein [Dinghuibacter silviterrae]TDW99157.1 carboxypeptidase-like protein [Dinghuibacter silviterrae]